MLENNSEQLTLAECEAIITKGVKGFYEIGKALSVINIHKLYRHAGHETFEDYCNKKWDFEHAYAYRLINSYNVIQQLESSDVSPIGDKLPTSESQTRVLAKIKDPEKRAEVWKKTVEESEESQEPITAKKIEAIRDEVIPSSEEKDPMENRVVTYLNHYYKGKFEEHKRGAPEADFLRSIIKAHLDHPELLAPYL